MEKIQEVNPSEVNQLGPVALRTQSRRNRWSEPSLTEDQNLALGIDNIQNHFIEMFPEFIERFPFDERGKIRTDQLIAAKQFILMKIGTHSLFIDSFGVVPLTKRRASYFKGKYRTVLEHSFQPWGINFNEDEVMELKVVNEDGISNSTISVASQRVGSEAIVSYMKGQSDFCDIPPFKVSHVIGNTSDRTRIYFGNLKAGKGLATYVNPKVGEIALKGGHLVILPKEDQHNGIQWIELFELLDNESIDIRKRLYQTRVDKENQRFLKQGWSGPEIEIFLKYLTGGSEIQVSEIPKFEIQLGKLNRIDFGEIEKKQIIATLDSSILKPGDRLTLYTKEDKERGYIFLEGYGYDSKGERMGPYFNKIDRQRTKIYQWDGPEIQSLIDWIKGSLPLHLASNITLELNEEGTFSLTRERKANISLKLKSLIKKGVKRILLVPKSDELYEWVDLFSVNDNGMVSSMPLYQLEVRRDRVQKLNSRWLGPERQPYLDYLDGKITVSTLKSFSVNVSRSQGTIYASLFNYHGRQFTIQIKRQVTSEFKKVTIVPISEETNCLILELWNDDQTHLIGIYYLDKEKLTLSQTSPERKSISPEEADAYLEGLLMQHKPQN